MKGLLRVMFGCLLCSSAWAGLQRFLHSEDYDSTGRPTDVFYVAPITDSNGRPAEGFQQEEQVIDSSGRPAEELQENSKVDTRGHLTMPAGHHPKTPDELSPLPKGRRRP